jgi:hypothetical protein
MQNHESTMACVSSLTASRIDDMCVCAESLDVEVTNRYQMVVQWLECLLIMTEYSGSNPEKWTIDFQQIQISKFVKNCHLNRDRTSDF